ncbi:hypothetical protein B0O99DRAFT_597594 [Bisporella sp. PMI_857]|nr:hypothetical protein B0O99DRAFT_597594 [Bisporella sp. PMI_857]
MLPHTVVLAIFTALVSQGNVAAALPHSPNHTYTERINGEKRRNIDSSEIKIRSVEVKSQPIHQSDYYTAGKSGLGPRFLGEGAGLEKRIKPLELLGVFGALGGILGIISTGISVATAAQYRATAAKIKKVLEANKARLTRQQQGVVENLALGDIEVVLNERDHALFDSSAPISGQPVAGPAAGTNNGKEVDLELGNNVAAKPEFTIPRKPVAGSAAGSSKAAAKPGFTIPRKPVAGSST